MHADARGRGSRLSKRSTTEQLGLPLELGPHWHERRPKLPGNVSLLRQKLYQKAKQEPRFRFYALYDRVYRKDVLQVAWEQVHANEGAPGPDGVTIDQIVRSEGGPGLLVDQLHEELCSKTYRPGAVRRVYIPKPDGRQRPLGIPNVRDRVVQLAVHLVLEPIFEADFEDSSYGFRPGRSAHGALGEIREHLKGGRTQVYDADLKSYFDSIPHDKLMAAVRVRIVDGSVLKLIRMWLQAVVMEQDEEGRPRGRRPKAGTPQGGVISPLLANIYLHWLDRAFRVDRRGLVQQAQAKLVRYADDFVVLARYWHAGLVRWIEELLETRLGLVINREKTRQVNLRQKGASVTFLGFTFRYDRDQRGRNHRYLNVVPSKKALASEREKLRLLTRKSVCFKPIPALICQLNRHLKGWAEYFDFGYPRVAFRAVNWYARTRLACHLKRRSQRPFRPPKGKTLYRHLADLGLVYL